MCKPFLKRRYTLANSPNSKLGSGVVQGWGRRQCCQFDEFFWASKIYKIIGMTENGPFLRIAAREEKRGFFWKIKYLGKFGNPVGHIVRKAAEKSDPLTFERHSNLPSDYNMQFEKSASPDSLVSLEWTCRNFCKIVIGTYSRCSQKYFKNQNFFSKWQFWFLNEIIRKVFIFYQIVELHFMPTLEL